MAKFYYGGQAVMEGVMMRGRISAAVAVRRPDQSIYLYEEALNPRLYQNPLFRLPFLRGLLLLWEMLVLGTRLMTFSANIATGAINPDAPVLPPDTADPTARNEKITGDALTEQPEAPPKIGGLTMFLPLLFSLSIAVAIFFVGPLFLANLLPSQIGTKLARKSGPTKKIA